MTGRRQEKKQLVTTPTDDDVTGKTAFHGRAGGASTFTGHGRRRRLISANKSRLHVRRERSVMVGWWQQQRPPVRREPNASVPPADSLPLLAACVFSQTPGTAAAAHTHRSGKGRHPRPIKQHGFPTGTENRDGGNTLSAGRWGGPAGLVSHDARSGPTYCSRLASTEPSSVS